MPQVSDIATIRNGYAFRGRIEPDMSGDTRVIQASDLAAGRELDTAALACVQLGAKAERYQLTEKDIVFVARGLRQRAYRPVRDTITGKPIITAFGLLVITAIESRVLPDYLYWALNTPRIQHAIGKLTEGTSLSFISDKNFGQVDIPLPTLDKQLQIEQLMAMHRQRAQLRQTLTQLDDTLVHSTAWSLATGITE